ncbi:MAG: ABC transporter permease subunit [Planctomycetota bacterium]|nr:ABC transporter permease subunit [Planctomycetota bacterium]MDA1212022.1 ABC transporter permease subunit [Planctomycetota bacterium]
MFAGPIFSREALTAPRQLKHFLLRSGYLAALIVLMYTAGQATFGFQEIRNLSSLAGFGSLTFQVFSLVQLSLVIFFALLLAVGNVAQEKDRKTLILLLMTDLRNHELVIGKLSASLLSVLMLVVSSFPIFAILYFLGGVTFPQICWSIALCASVALAAGSWGTLVAFAREKTFQTISLGVLGLVLYLGIVEGLLAVVGAQSAETARWLHVMNPYRTVLDLINPWDQVHAEGVSHVSASGAVGMMLGITVLLNLISIAYVRRWNTSHAVFEQAMKKEEEQSQITRKKVKVIWSNPVIWREICTRAYGRKVIVIKLIYLLFVAFMLWQLSSTFGVLNPSGKLVSPAGVGFIALGLISLMLVNAQAVTAITSERDGQTMELLLVTDITAKEFVYGKLGGILYNTKELTLIPLGWIVYLAAVGGMSAENAVYTIIGYVMLTLFSAMLGVHSGLTYDSSRAAIANSLGTMFFLFIGICIFMVLLVEARSSFFLQLQSFLVFILMGSIGLWKSLTYKNPSSALTFAAGLLPFLTFYAIAEFLLSGSLGVCLWITLAYGFTTLAMLIPAISEFDFALGRTTLDN